MTKYIRINEAGINKRMEKNLNKLEKLSIKQINCDGAIEFLRLCQNFGLTPTFAKLDETKANKWKH